MRQLAYETHRIHQYKLMIGIQSHTALLSIQSGEEHVLLKYRLVFLFSHGQKSVHKGRLSRVGVAHQRHNRDFALFPSGSLHSPCILYLGKLRLYIVHSLFNVPPVCLQLFFSRSSRTYSSPKA